MSIAPPPTGTLKAATEKGEKFWQCQDFLPRNLSAHLTALITSSQQPSRHTQ